MIFRVLGILLTHIAIGGVLWASTDIITRKLFRMTFHQYAIEHERLAREKVGKEQLSDLEVIVQYDLAIIFLWPILIAGVIVAKSTDKDKRDS